MGITKYNTWKNSSTLNEAPTDVDPRVEGFRQFLVNKRREARGLQALTQSDKKETAEEISKDADITPVSGELNIKQSPISDKKMAEKIVDALKKY